MNGFSDEYDWGDDTPITSDSSLDPAVIAAICIFLATVIAGGFVLFELATKP